MRIGVPKEIVPGETRIAASPDSIRKFTALGVEVLVECGAGMGAQMSDEALTEAGAQTAPDAKTIYAEADLVTKVRAPLTDGNALDELALVRPEAVLVGLVTLFTRMFGLTAGYHRYFCHRAFKTSRAFQFVLAWLGASAAQRGPLWWGGHHRWHHRHSDTEQDVHPPGVKGMVWAHAGWIMSAGNDRTRMEWIRDFARFPELRWLDANHHVAPIRLGVALFGLGYWLGAAYPALGTSGAQLLVVGLFCSTTILYHVTFAVNSLGHRFGGVVESPNTHPLRGKITSGARTEGWAFYLEEGIMNAGVIDDLPRVRELIYIFGIFRAARVPADVWLHARHAGGAHVVLRWTNPERPPATDPAEAAVLAANHSRARGSTHVPVDWTRRKWVRKPRGAPPGTVMPDRVQTLFVAPDPSLDERLGG